MTSKKQSAILRYLASNETMTLAQAVELIGGDIYANKAKHVGALLSNMVKRFKLVRVKAGLFRRITHDDLAKASKRFDAFNLTE